MLNFLKNIGPVEWVILILILILLFGSRFVKGLGRASGETVREIKKVKNTFTEALEDDEPEKDKKEASK